MDVLPSPDDIAFFREHGWWISPRILDRALIDAAARDQQRYYAGERDRAPAQYFPPEWNWRPENGDVLRKSDYTTLEMRALAALAMAPAISAIAARLIGAGAIRLWHDQLLQKPVDDGRNRGRANVGWHTDRGYWQTCTSERMLTAWIPFHDVDEAMGAMRFIDGSHRWGEQSPALTNAFDGQDLDAAERLIASGGAELRKVPAILAKGQVSFHDCRLIHGSGPNLGTAPRRALAVHLQDGDNRFRLHRRDATTWAWHHNDRLCRRGADGLPDYADPAICPLTYGG